MERMTFVEAAPMEKLGQTSRMSRFIFGKTTPRNPNKKGNEKSINLENN